MAAMRGYGGYGYGYVQRGMLPAGSGYALGVNAYGHLQGQPIPVPRQVPKPRQDMTVMFRPGKLGMTADWETGVIERVEDVGQAQTLGVKPGMCLRAIDTIPYSEDLLDERIAGDRQYSATFVWPGSVSATRSQASASTSGYAGFPTASASYLGDSGLRYQMCSQPSGQAMMRHLDGRQCVRLVPLAPRVNRFHCSVSSQDINSDQKSDSSSNDEDQESERREAARQRLTELLQKHSVRERAVKADGNCQFRALADQLYGTEEHHAVMREQVVAQLRGDPSRYSGFVPGRFEEYIKDMARDCTWGDHVTLQAAADILGVRINLITDYVSDAFIEVAPQQQKTNKILTLCFWSEVHYNSTAS